MNDQNILETLVDTIQKGGVIAYPTEGVWGIGCDPWNHDAVMKVLSIKHRPVEKGMILIGNSQSQFSPLIESLSDHQKQQLNDTWPGPYTWIIPDPTQWTPNWVRGQFNTIAIRVTGHPVVCQLCEAVGHPLVSTSANLSGEPSLMTMDAVSQHFSTRLDGIMPGATGGRMTPSEIRDLRTGKVIRAGS
ncbi:Threonylcarbamoyl-AMP synthase [invertebrate metagenome]|uniref:L-threonylcarbamoyladenylate synthase n=1 Tax=invertebrate metagenome TaxID=1711999 RepID=A0A2H9T6T1_9ZZZZ